MEQLTKRARNVLLALNIRKPSDLTDQANTYGLGLLPYILRTPNCGRKTAAEILKWYEASAPDPMPRYVWVNIQRDAYLRWRVFATSLDRRDGPDWYLAQVATPKGET